MISAFFRSGWSESSTSPVPSCLVVWKHLLDLLLFLLGFFEGGGVS